MKLSIQAVKINLLGGRVFIKNAAIVTKNELVLVHSAVLTWKYWLQFVRKSQFYVQEKNLNHAVNKSLPCRFTLDVVGLEVFVYNRTPAYENIEEILKEEVRQNREKDAKHSKHSKHSHKRYKSQASKTFTEDITSQTDDDDINVNSTLKHRRNLSGSTYESTSTTSPSTIDESLAYDQQNTKNSKSESDKTFDDDDDNNNSHESPPTEVMDSTFLDFLPFEINVSKGSFVLGNETTPSLYVASFNTMDGHIDATLPGSVLDYYRTHYDFTVADLKVDLRTNVSFKDIDALEKKIRNIQNKKKAKNFFSLVSGLENSFKSLHMRFNKQPQHRQKFKYFGASSESSTSAKNSNYSNTEEWHGLERYLTTVSSADSELDSRLYDYDKQKMIDAEYAKYSNIVVAQKCKINYYYDSQGLVPAEKVSIDYVEEPDIGNKDIPPMFGLDVTLSGATICYGPWAEKQRGSLHQLLFPPLYRNTVPFKKLKTGMRRQYVSFDLSIQCDDELIFQIPHREESKDINFLKNSIPTLRHFGWLNLKMAEGSITDISISLISTEEKGTDNKINAVFIKPEISTSVNHDILFEADEHILNASIAFPLEWNSLVDWQFENISKGVSIYLLREHVTLLSDLFSDFSSGDPTPYELFRPFIYRLNWKLYDYSIYLNINEQNIINNPLDSSINTYLTFKGAYLYLNTKIPLTNVYKKSNKVDYVLETTYFDLSVEHPSSSTFSNFTQTEEIGNAQNFKMEGSYTYFSFMEIDSVDTIIMNCSCEDTTLKVYGFAVKYFMSLKENYFGDSTHFQTLLEFRDNFGDTEKENPSFEGKRLKNETDLMFSFCVDNGCLVFPCHLYDCVSHLALHFDDLDIDIRNNNYYMDLQADFSEVRGRYIEECDESIIFENTKSKVEFEPELLIDGLSVHSIRIFGLPPLEPTYFCRWTFDSDGVNIVSEPIFLNALSRAGQSFKFGHKDLENSLNIPETSVTDIINLTFRCPLIGISLKNSNYVFKINLFDIIFKMSDQPTPYYNTLVDVKIKDLVMECFQDSIQLLKITTSVGIKNFVQKKNAFELMKEQSMHLKKHDAPYHRTPFLIPEFAKDRKYYKGLNSITSSLYLPDPPLPLTTESVEMIVDSFPVHVQRKLASISTEFDLNDDDVFDEAHRFSSNFEDFGVLKGLDPTCEYDNIPVKLDRLDIFVAPAMAPIAVDLISNMTDFNMYSYLDDLQTQFVNFFQYKEKNTITRCKLECPLITFKLADSITATDYLFLGITDLIFAFAKTAIVTKPAMNVYTMFKELNIDIVRNNEDALLLSFYRLLFKQSFEKRQISTVDLENISFFIDPIYIPWMISWGFELKETIDSVTDKWKRFQKDNHAAKVELLYDLSRGGIDYNITHDPPCITKPSYITGFCPNHIRMDGNWMIIPRLRHILQNLPKEWIENKNKMFSEKTWEAPKNAEDEVLIIFGNWRCWDNHKTKDNFIFKEVFEFEIEEKEKFYNSVKLTLKNITISSDPFTNAFTVSDIALFVHEDDLSKRIKEVAMPLLDIPIEKSLDVTFKIESLTTNFSKISRIFNKMPSLLDEIKNELSKFKTTANDSESDDAMGSTASLDNVARYEAVKPVLITVNFSLYEFSHSIGIDKSNLTFYGQGVDLTASMVKAEEMMSCTLNYKNDFFSSELYVGRIPIFELNCESHTATLINTGSFELGKTAILISTDNVSFNFLPDTRHLIKALLLLNEKDFALLKPVIDSFKKTSSAESSNIDSSFSSSSSHNNLLDLLATNIFGKIKMDVSTSVSISKVMFHFELISPFFTNFEISKPTIFIRFGEFGFLTEFIMNRSEWFIGSQTKNHVFEYTSTSIDKMKFSITGHYKTDIYELLVSLVTGVVRMNVARNNLVDLISKGRHDFLIMSKYLDDLKIVVESIVFFTSEEAPRSSVKQVPANSPSDNIFFEKLGNLIHTFFDIKFGNIMLLANLNGNKIHFDCSKPVINIKTYDENLQKFSPHGTVLLPSSHVTVGLNGIHGVSTLFELKTRIEIKNPNVPEHKLQRVEIYTDHCRFVLNPHILEEAIEAYGDIAISVGLKESKPVHPTDAVDLDEKLGIILSFFSIKIVAKNVCFGWLFDGEDILYPGVVPGIILGFEDASIMCAKGAGKIQMEGMYISLAHGSNTSNFYSLKCEKHSNNRAYLPFINLIYSYESNSKLRNFKSQVDGDQIDFKFQTNIISMTEPFWISVVTLQDKFSYVQSVINQKNSINSRRSTEVNDTNNSTLPLSPLQSRKKITNISCAFNFAGASFFIYNSNVEINGSIPILSLKSPKLSFVLKYAHDFLALKKHTIFLSALISETNNKLSCMCVPVIQDMLKGFRAKMRKKNSISSNNKPKENQGIDIVHLSEKVDVNFSLKIEPQRLALSCEPRANVEAEVAIDDIHLIVKTDQDCLSAVLSIRKVKSELKHAYSKVISGSVFFDNLTISASMTTINGEKKLSTVGKLNEVGMFVNMQQRQDVDLFKDLWLPSDFNNSLLVKKNKSNENKKTFASMLREVSTTAAFPWVLSLLISKLSAKVDLGSSLGELYIDIKDLMAVSTKSAEWDQNLKIESEKIYLESRGRLSGMLKAEQTRMTSAISWKNGKVLEVPLVLLSFGVKSLQTKISLDYHPFFILELIKFSVTVYNQQLKDSHSGLRSTLNMESLKIFMTALAASNFVDVYTIGLRIRQDIKLSYRQVLNDAQVTMTGGRFDFGDDAIQEEKSLDVVDIVPLAETFFNMIEKLKTYLSVDVGLLEIQVFPSSLLDSQAMVINIGKTKAEFYQNTVSEVENRLSLDLSDITVSLSSFKTKPTSEALCDPSDIKSYVDMASTSIADNIFVFPSLKIMMATLQNEGENVIRYKYACKFGGKVDIKWKIGSVYFIRQMWYTHATTLNNRLTALRIYTSDEYDVEENYKESAFEAVNLEDKLKDVESDKKFVYYPVEEPDIETPMLKDLGNATPPLEWFGLHRDKFPNLTHQVVVIGLQKMIRKVEQNYSKVLK